MIVFFTENEQTEYSKCFSVINFLRNGEVFSLNSPLKILLLDDNEIKNDGYYDFNTIYKKCAVSRNVVEIKDSFNLHNYIGDFSGGLAFCFYITNMDGKDLVQLHYFELIRQYENNCFLLIESTAENYYRISDFYQIESRIYPDTYSHRYFKDIAEKQVKRLALKNNKASKRFLPLLRTELDVYTLFSKNIFEVFSFSKDKLLVKKEKDSANQGCVVEKLIIDFCLMLIKEINTKVENKIILSWGKYRELLSHTSVLGLCYFLSYLYIAFTDKTFEISSFEITHLLLQSEDFSMGTIQLIENAFKHAKNGYFCYRIHKSVEKSIYLKDNYDINCNDKTPPFYLEVLISDFNNESDIPKKFIQNIKSRADFNVSDEMLNTLEEKLKLKDFFNPTGECKEFWQKYYEDKSNIALHYGLNIFEQVVMSSEGKFILDSSSDLYLSSDKRFGYEYVKPNDIKNLISHIPGTQYKIILPIKKVSFIQKSTGLKLHLDTQQLKKEWKQKTIHFIQKQNVSNIGIENDDIPFTDFTNCDPQYKEATVKRLFEILKSKVCDLGKNTIVVFDVKEFHFSIQSEVFAKALICLLSKTNIEKIAIINASHKFMSTFIRVFGLLYYKKITCDFLEKSEIYLCGDFNLESDNNVEVIFKGKDIRKSVWLSKQIADYKGEYSSELSILENIAVKCEKTRGRKSAVEVFPFDVLVKTKNQTLFQEKTIYDLKQDLQCYHFGCRLSDVHMKVGSKIHITSDFYEATLLFGIENYISRFAYLLAKKISQEVKEKKVKENIVLIGYETYSEILMLETKNMLKQIYGIDSKYLIYDDSAKEKKFRDTSETQYDGSSSRYIIIVPIGSTLTTHDKISAELRREFKLENNDGIISNLCVVLVRDETQKNTLTKTEKLFWKSISESQVVLKDDYNIGNGNKVDYIVSVNNKWEKPDECKYCFPKKLHNEKPILKVNKASVIPMILMGIKEECSQPFTVEHTKISHGNVLKLKNHLKYGHFLREDNHFEYYFNTESLATDVTNTERFNEWLEEVRDTLKASNRKNSTLQFDFVVAPQHSTNAEFVMQINEKVFGNPASVIFLDVKKEYRDNIKTKFSNLTQLYNNLYSYGRPAVINFHYVDDTITTGETFNRTKSLIQSLFPEFSVIKNSGGKVEVNVFSSVILLLGRCSSDTKRNYAPKGKFFDFFELKISAMRNYKDACVLCKKHDEYEEMRKLSSTNAMESALSHRVKKYRPLNYTEDDAHKQFDGYERMLITQEFNKRLSKLGFKKNNDEEVKRTLAQLTVDILNGTITNEEVVNQNTYLCAFIHVISSPFATFRKSVLSASFELLLKIASFLLFKNCEKDDYLGDELKNYIRHIEKKHCTTELGFLIKAVFDGLSRLGANFVMRVKTINAFFTYIEEHFSTGDKDGLYKEWIVFYSQIVNKSLMLNRQDSRVLWLEKILKFNNEGNSKLPLNDDVNIKMLKQILLLENTLILSDTLDEVVYALQNEITNNRNNIKNEFLFENSQKQDVSHLTKRLDNFVKISEDTETDLLLNILFNNKGTIRSEEKFLDVIEITLQSYFCEAFRMFSEINNSLKNEQLLKMSILYLLLLPNGSISGTREEHLKFYDILSKQIKSVLKASKVQLFMAHDKNIDFICSSDGNNMDCDMKYEEFLQEICLNHTSVSVGETYYTSKKNKTLNAIRIANNSLDEKCDFTSDENEVKTAWYLVFEFDANLLDEDRLRCTRNLLVMREKLLLRLKKDYDNNLYAEFLELRKKVQKLTDDKAGGHTPFAELSEDFDYLYDLSNNCSSCDDNKEKVANNMKLITDLLISKLYVCHINEESYPKQIETRKRDIQYNCLNNYKNILQCASNLVLRRDGSLTIKPNISFDGVDWEREFTFMKKSTFIWISIFYALIMNSLRHGTAYEIIDNSFSYVVNIEVKTKDNYLVISNDYCPHKQNDKKDGITLETVKAFFEHYGFEFKIDESVDEKYIVKMPLEKRE